MRRDIETVEGTKDSPADPSSLTALRGIFFSLCAFVSLCEIR